KYRMPPVRLDDEARQLLTSYRWPGNVRELKNITERISVIEENRDITADVLRLYLPDLNVEKYPVLVKKQDNDQKFFNSEREILYQVLFDMKKDVNDLKKLVHDIMGGKMPMPVADETPYAHPIRPVHSAPIQEAEAVEEEETLSLEEVEKEMIRKALEKHNGRRKNAAADLKISERTLYRKIKEYNLE
ncbi:sigma-54-dependent Fis family transcriptional regulator, partial [Parabacteroides goldsteinii]|nr:sigma-54-dependent Fis family transcriptional regulator [Parabacteroides goldsteinii]